jgi:hypothetical protein
MISKSFVLATGFPKVGLQRIWMGALGARSRADLVYSHDQEPKGHGYFTYEGSVENVGIDWEMTGEK